jgi:hypothetical protein
VASRGAFPWREVVQQNDMPSVQQAAALSLLCLVVDGNNETQQKERGASCGATAPEICVLNAYYLVVGIVRADTHSEPLNYHSC